MIICVVGPTGVGKTKMSIELAKKYDAIIINCDAVQVYKKMDIASAKIKEEEKENIKHYLLDICEVEENYSIFDYQKDCRKIIEENKNKNIIIVGGTGLYLSAALFDYRFTEDNDTNEYLEYSNEELYDLVFKKDPKTTIHKNNRKRLVRFLNKKDLNEVEPKLLYDNVYFIGLTTNRDNLYSIINSRVDKMIDEGLIEEAKYFYDLNIECKSLSTCIGYKELFLYFDEKITLEEALEMIKKKSRNYAKRQYTWFNNKIDVNWFETNYQDFDSTVKEVINYIEKHD